MLPPARSNTLLSLFFYRDKINGLNFTTIKIRSKIKMCMGRTGTKLIKDTSNLILNIPSLIPTGSTEPTRILKPNRMQTEFKQTQLCK